LVAPQPYKIRGGKISGFEKESFTPVHDKTHQIQMLLVSKFPLENSGFKISGDFENLDMTKLGSFHFRFVNLCVNRKITPELKCSEFIMNPEQFLPV